MRCNILSTSPNVTRLFAAFLSHFISFSNTPPAVAKINIPFACIPDVNLRVCIWELIEPRYTYNATRIGIRNTFFQNPPMVRNPLWNVSGEYFAFAPLMNNADWFRRDSGIEFSNYEIANGRVRFSLSISHFHYSGLRRCEQCAQFAWESSRHLRVHWKYTFDQYIRM